MNYRMDRINSLLLREIGKIINDDVKDPRISSLISVMEVKTSKDLKFSKIYISVLAEPNVKNKTLKALNSASGYIKSLLVKKLNLRNVPKLVFYLDESIENKLRILDIIDNLGQSSNINDN